MFTSLSTNFALNNQHFHESFFPNLLLETKIKIRCNKNRIIAFYMEWSQLLKTES